MLAVLNTSKSVRCHHRQHVSPEASVRVPDRAQQPIPD
jgi:hypothetical protein